MIPVPKARRKPDFSLATINIVFLLLLFFLSVGTIVDSQELGVEAPETSELPLDRLPRPLLLIDLDGNLSLDGEALNSETLLSVAKAAGTDKAGAARAINILAAAELPGRDLVNVVAKLSAEGLQTKLVTLRDAKQ